MYKRLLDINDIRERKKWYTCFYTKRKKTHNFALLIYGKKNIREIDVQYKK